MEHLEKPKLKRHDDFELMKLAMDIYTNHYKFDDIVDECRQVQENIRKDPKQRNIITQRCWDLLQVLECDSCTNPICILSNLVLADLGEHYTLDDLKSEKANDMHLLYYARLCTPHVYFEDGRKFH
ncbi:Oidioi.mRNA.OKI2018_I69.chr2.g7958.t1.cds [Oikopleura dioica]|uniref:Oidioi.mRNA.OKI2018_I69.chr2.g7958.t1.cds n=1 Tax=Oikopleura dioica TaxID=34765 RepID=A0ABN7T8A5_OIKDI|nr:Oidioi.mRNA.OKI2018_I69.chr2.g7958.t1.cds [Oikopleura dioica]